MQAYSYDEVPYESTTVVETHPIRSATIGMLFGMTPTAVNRCRVLELGCGDGINLIPLAENYPESVFVGIDLSAVQIARGQSIVRDLGLTNIALEPKSLMEFDAKGEKFDYIIAHGLYSWVPEESRDRILSLCRECLTDQGIALVSFNTLPGWHMRGMIRDMMRFHTEQFSDPRQQQAQARELMAFLANSVSTENNPYGQFLKKELEHTHKRANGYLYHELLGAENCPCYFHEFMAKAQGHNLQYLGEAEFSAMLTANLSGQVKGTLEAMGRDIVGTEQYMDFVRLRMFRMTLLVRREVQLTRSVSPSLTRRLWVSALTLSAKENPNLGDGVREEFRTISTGAKVQSDSALSKIMFVCLQRVFPNQLTFAEFAAEVRALYAGGRSGVSDPALIARDESLLTDQLMLFFGKGFVALSAFPYPPVDLRTAGNMTVPSLTRYQAKDHSRLVTNLRHSSHDLDLFSRHVTTLLDGSRDLEKLTEAMAEKVQGGLLHVEKDGAPVKDDAVLKSIIRARIPIALAGLSRSAFLRRSEPR